MKIDIQAFKYKQYIIPLLIILAFTSFFFHYFTETVRIEKEVEEGGQIEEIATISAKHVRNRIETYMRFAATAAAQVSEFKNIRSPEVSLVMNRIAKETNVDFIEILYPDGSRRTSSPSMFTTNSSIFYTNRAKMFTSVINGQNFITFVAPVKKDGHISAQVRCSVRAEAMDTVMHNKALNSGGTMIFMHNHGEWLHPQPRGSILSRVNNIFDFMQQPGITVSVPLEQIMNAFTNNESLFFRYAKNKSSRLCYITPLGLSDWYLGVVMPAATFGSEDTGITKDALALLYRILFLFMILTIFIIYREKCHAKKIYAANRMEREIIANIPGGVQKYTADRDFSYEFVSAGFASMAGCKNESETVTMFGGSFWNSIFEKDRKRVKKHILNSVSENKNFETTYRMLRKDGRIIHVLCNGSLTKNPRGQKSVCCVTLDISKIHESAEDLKMRNKMYEIATAEADIYIIEYSPENDSMHISQKCAQKFGLPFQIKGITEVLSAAAEESHSPDEEKSMPAAFLEMLKKIKNGAKSASASHYLTSGRDGKQFYVTTHFTAVYNEGGELIKIIGVMRDDTESRAVAKECLQTEKYKDTLLSLYDRVYEYDLTNNKIIRGMENYTRYLPSNEMNVSGVKKYFTSQYSHPDDQPIIKDLLTEEVALEYLAKGISELDIEFRNRTAKDSEEYRWKSAHISIFIEPSDSSVRDIWYLKDITESVRKTERLRFMAERDPLTRLFNKKTAETLIREKMDSDLTASTKTMNAFTMLDLDDFKKVNDMLGHAFGDAIIEEVGRRIKETFRNTDIVGRIGGDEFIIFMKDIPSKKIAIRKVYESAARIREIQSDITKDLPISASIGVAFSPDDGTTLEELYSKSDIALYRSKDTGKDNVTIYDESMGTEFGRVENIVGEIESTEGGNFSYNMPRHTFKILCDAKDLRLSVSLVLELISKHFAFLRGYVFRDSEDGLTCSQIYEWCAEGVEPEIDKCGKMLYSEDFKGLKESFSEDGIYLYQKAGIAGNLPSVFRPGHKNTGIAVAMLEEGKFKGFIGFDCSEEVAASLTQRQISDITMSAQTVAAFILSVLTDTKSNGDANIF